MDTINNWRRNRMQLLNTKHKGGFTLIELLIVIGIIAVLVGVLIPSIDRSMSTNKLATDVEVFRSKLEEARLLAGSTQTSDESNAEEIVGTDRVGYYGIYIPGTVEPSQPFYAIVRLSSPVTQTGDGFCSGSAAALQANAGEGPCLVERIKLTKGVKFNTFSIFNANERIIAYRVPSQQVTEIVCTSVCGQSGHIYTEVANLTTMFNAPNTYFELTYNSKIASLKFEPFTAKLKVEYR